MIEKNKLMEKCKLMKEQGSTDIQIAKFYLSESKKIAKKEQRIHDLLKTLRKHDSARLKEKQPSEKQVSKNKKTKTLKIKIFLKI